MRGGYLLRIGLVGCCVLSIWHGIDEEITARREKSPTKMRVADFATRYHGQRWVEIPGRSPRSVQ